MRNKIERSETSVNELKKPSACLHSVSKGSFQQLVGDSGDLKAKFDEVFGLGDPEAAEGTAEIRGIRFIGN